MCQVSNSNLTECNGYYNTRVLTKDARERLIIDPDHKESTYEHLSDLGDWYSYTVLLKISLFIF